MSCALGVHPTMGICRYPLMEVAANIEWHICIRWSHARVLCTLGNWSYRAAHQGASCQSATNFRNTCIWNSVWIWRLCLTGRSYICLNVSESQTRLLQAVRSKNVWQCVWHQKLTSCRNSSWASKVIVIQW